MNTDQDLESMLWLARQTSFMAGREAERERIIKLIWDNAETITNQYFYHNALIGEPTAFLIALIKGENK